jgi:hypothetical protein
LLKELLTPNTSSGDPGIFRCTDKRFCVRFGKCFGVSEDWDDVKGDASGVEGGEISEKCRGKELFRAGAIGSSLPAPTQIQ